MPRVWMSRRRSTSTTTSSPASWAPKWRRDRRSAEWMPSRWPDSSRSSSGRPRRRPTGRRGRWDAAAGETLRRWRSWSGAAVGGSMRTAVQHPIAWQVEIKFNERIEILNWTDNLPRLVHSTTGEYGAERGHLALIHRRKSLRLKLCSESQGRLELPRRRSRARGMKERRRCVLRAHFCGSFYLALAVIAVRGGLGGRKRASWFWWMAGCILQGGGALKMNFEESVKETCFDLSLVFVFTFCSIAGRLDDLSVWN